jgi:hypothetical protein
MQVIGDIIALNWNTKIKAFISFCPTQRRSLSGSEPLLKIENLASSFTIDNNIDGHTQLFAWLQNWFGGRVAELFRSNKLCHLTSLA